MTNAVVAAVTLLVQTNSSRVLPNPTGLGATIYHTNITSEVLTYSSGGVMRSFTNAIETNVFEVATRKLVPEVPPVPNQPRKL